MRSNLFLAFIAFFLVASINKANSAWFIGREGPIYLWSTDGNLAIYCLDGGFGLRYALKGNQKFDVDSIFSSEKIKNEFTQSNGDLWVPGNVIGADIVVRNDKGEAAQVAADSYSRDSDESSFTSLPEKGRQILPILQIVSGANSKIWVDVVVQAETFKSDAISAHQSTAAAKRFLELSESCMR